MFKGLTKQEKAWVLYDVGNSAFTMLACSLIPIWFKELAEGEGPGMLSKSDATSYWAFAISLVTVVVALLGPVLGAIADHKDKKKIFFTTIVALGVIGCVLNGMVVTWIAFIVIHVLSKIFYSSSLTFYDSMLGDVTTEERMDQVSSYGFAWGYIGSCIPFAVAMVAYILGGGGGILKEPVISAQMGRIIGFAVTGIWWLLVTLPLLKHYRQVNYVEPEKHAIKYAFMKIGRTLKNIATKDKKVLWFLVAFFLYIDGVGTIIDNCINIGTHLGLDTVGQVVLLLGTQVVAFGGSLVFARLSKKYDTVFLIKICIVGYFCVCLYALTLSTLLHFAVLAFGVGCFQGSIQSLSRSYYSKIIPAENSGEYFGLYDIFAKGASFLGSAMIGVVLKLTVRPDNPDGSINIAVALLAVFFALGFIFITISDKKKKLKA